MKADRTLLLLPVLCLVLSGCRKTGAVRYLDGPDDLHGQTICAQVGSISDLYISEHYKDSEIKYVEVGTDIPVMVVTGKADAGVTTSLVWMTHHKQYPELSCFHLEECSSDIAFPVSKDNPGLAAELNAFLDGYLQTDGFNEMVEDWSADPEGHRMPVTDAETCNREVLTVALAPDQPPYDMIRNGGIVGIEPEILTRFAIETGRQIKFVPVNFSGIIPCITSGKADMGCCIMSITEERSRSVMFTKPWTREVVDVLVRTERMSKSEGGPAGLQSAAGNGKPSLWQRTRSSFEQNVIHEDRYRMLLQGSLITIVISLLSALFGTVLGVLLSMGSLSRYGFFRKFSDIYIGFMRCIPQVVLLMIMFYVVLGKTSLSGTAVAVVAFSMCFGAYTSVIFTSTMKGIDRGQREAALSMGFTPYRTFMNFILPQVVQRALPVYRNEFISLVKATSIVGYITVFDLTRAGDIIRSRTFEAFFPLLIVTVIYFIIIWLLILLLKYAQLKSQPVVHKYSKKH